MKTLIILAGIGQIALALASTVIPRFLDWKSETARLETLTRRVFWTYAGYILATNLAFGLLSLIAPDALLDGSRLASCVCGFIALYWGARLVIQFTVFRRLAPPGRHFRVAEILLVLLFVYLTFVYGAVALGLQ